jgi:hypothetical protein
LEEEVREAGVKDGRAGARPVADERDALALQARRQLVVLAERDDGERALPLGEPLAHLGEGDVIRAPVGGVELAQAQLQPAPVDPAGGVDVVGDGSRVEPAVGRARVAAVACIDLVEPLGVVVGDPDDDRVTAARSVGSAQAGPPPPAAARRPRARRSVAQFRGERPVLVELERPAARIPQGTSLRIEERAAVGCHAQRLPFRAQDRVPLGVDDHLAATLGEQRLELVRRPVIAVAVGPEVARCDGRRPSDRGEHRARQEQASSQRREAPPHGTGSPAPT